MQITVKIGDNRVVTTSYNRLFDYIDTLSDEQFYNVESTIAIVNHPGRPDVNMILADWWAMNYYMRPL